VAWIKAGVLDIGHRTYPTLTTLDYNSNLALLLFHRVCLQFTIARTEPYQSDVPSPVLCYQLPTEATETPDSLTPSSGTAFSCRWVRPNNCYCSVWSSSQWLLLFNVKVRTKLRPTVSQPVCLSARNPFGTRDQFFFFFIHLHMLVWPGSPESKWKRCYDWRSVSQSVSQCIFVSSPFWFSWSDVCYCLTVTNLPLSDALSDERLGLSFVSMYISIYIACICLSYKVVYTRPLSVQARYSKLCPIIRSSRYHGCLDTWRVIQVTAAKFMPQKQ
jgi:hypothetical protein